ncbi:muconate cycloisomerase [Rhodopseudomonas boonkerdii]|uniref:muconate/chloromuconate family cycloisomerase n=1 Tax=Rhodopseudomonas boonkerdii TaxID=475937 RepID=UPI001E640F3D|nr:muconate/chloromuconate family cycloisomerase [Rhodopseudomonas boonkerdii]UGV27615.1 muconate cycloisomerase [Rhodopseudomonas boonkerdii]
MDAPIEVRVDTVETILVDVPTIRPHKLSMHTMNSQTLVLVMIRCSDGTIGIGEGTTIGGLSYGEESPEGIKLAIDTYIAPAIVGADASRVAALMGQVKQRVKGNRFATCAVETALLDALGKRLGLPVSELLGGRQHRKLAVAWTLASGDTTRDIEEAERMLDARRHNIFKLKIGLRSVKDDVAHVAAIKRSLGDRASVRVDVNQAWSEVDARHGIPALEAAGVDLIEQPLSRDDRGAQARLSGRFAVAIMADEALHGVRDAFDLAARGAADVFALKINQAGGLYDAVKMAAIGEAAGIGLYGGTMLEGGVGTAASAQVFSALPKLAWGTELFGPLLLTEEILATPLRYSDFTLEVPTAPGIGVELDMDRVAFFQRDGFAPRSRAVASGA